MRAGRTSRARRRQRGEVINTNVTERLARGRKLFDELSDGRANEAVETFGDLGHYLVEFIYGEIQARPGLSRRDRELMTVAMLAAMGGRDAQLDIHMNVALKAGITIEELREVMIHVAAYAGFPAALNGMLRLRALDPES